MRRQEEIARNVTTWGIPRQRSNSDEIIRIPHKLHVAHAAIHYSEFFSPDLPLDAPRTLVSPGWVGGEAIYGPLAKALVRLGHRAYTFGQGRSQSGLLYQVEQVRHPQKLISQTIRGIVHDVSRRSGKAPVNLVGHSRSGGSVLQAANHMSSNGEKELVGGVSIAMGAGFTNHSIADMLEGAKGVYDEATSNWWRLSTNPDMDESQLRVAWQSVHCIARNIVRTTAEGLQCGNGNNIPELETAMEDGLPVSAIFTQGDALFPADQARETIGDIVDYFSDFDEVPEAGHLALQFYAEEAARAINFGLRATGAIQPLSLVTVSA